MIIAIPAILLMWCCFALFCVATKQEAHLGVVERICTALEWLSGWLNRLACFGRAGADAYRMMLKRDTPRVVESTEDEMPDDVKADWEKWQAKKRQEA
jgi:hypothetical protein